MSAAEVRNILNRLAMQKYGMGPVAGALVGGRRRKGKKKCFYEIAKPRVCRDLQTVYSKKYGHNVRRCAGYRRKRVCTYGRTGRKSRKIEKTPVKMMVELEKQEAKTEMANEIAGITRAPKDIAKAQKEEIKLIKLEDKIAEAEPFIGPMPFIGPRLESGETEYPELAPLFEGLGRRRRRYGRALIGGCDGYGAFVGGTRRNKAAARRNPWLQHLRRFRSQHPELEGLPQSEIVHMARASYHPRGGYGAMVF